MKKIAAAISATNGAGGWQRFNHMLDRILSVSIRGLLFLLPWQTIWIVREQFIGGEKWQEGTLGFYATEAFLWFAVVLFLPWFYRRWRTACAAQPMPFRWTQDRIFALAAFIAIAYLFASSLWAPYPDVARQYAFRALEVILLIFLLLAGPLPRRDILLWFSLGSIVPSVLGIAQFLLQTAPSFGILGLAEHIPSASGTSIIQTGAERWMRAYGTFPHPNIFGGYLALGIIATDLLLDDTATPRASALLPALSLIQTMALFFTFSRSAWMAAGVWSLILVWRYRHRAAIARIALALILSAVFSPLIGTRMAGTSYHEIRSIEERTSGYAAAWNTFRRSPALGAGIRPGTPTHNIPLLVLSQFGIIGALLFASCMAAFWRMVRPQGLAYWAFGLSLIPIALLDHYLLTAYAGLLLWGVFPILSTDHPHRL
jgi:hypothetical protein